MQAARGVVEREGVASTLTVGGGSQSSRNPAVRLCSISDNCSAFTPQDAPVAYFLFVGEGIYIGVTLLMAAYCRAHKLFLRL